MTKMSKIVKIVKNYKKNKILPIINSFKIYFFNKFSKIYLHFLFINFF